MATTQALPRADEDALRRLHQVHGPPLLRYLIRRTQGDVHRAEDILQETLVRAWRNPQSRHPDGEWNRAWIYTVAKRILIDQVRAAGSRPVECHDEQMEAHLHHADDPIDRLIDTGEVRDALGALPDRLRLPLVEIYYRQRTAEEVARLLGIPAGTVRSRTFYGIRALRESLTARGYLA